MEVEAIGNSGTCDFCSKEPRKYTCPRCNLNYCSLTCYHSFGHGTCSEDFYRECVTESLKTDPPCSSDKIREIFNRAHRDDPTNDAFDSDDEDDCVSLSERLAGVDLDDFDEVWDRLKSDEKQEFEAFLRSGDVTEYVPKWQPWWLTKFNDKVLDVEALERHKRTCPKIVPDIKALTAITKCKPDKSVYFNMVNVIASYAVIVRYFNGCHFEFIFEAVNSIIWLASNLRTNDNLANLDEAIASVQAECYKSEHITVDNENMELMRQDVGEILAGPCGAEKNFYALSALSDLRALIGQYLGNKMDKQASNRFVPENVKISKKMVKTASRKIDYLLSYANQL